MKSQFLQRTAACCLFGICIASAPLSFAQQPPNARAVELLTPQIEPFMLGHLLGKPVRGANQEQYSTVVDFLVDPQSGRVAFAVTDAGSNTFRLVPMSALESGSGANGLQIRLDRGQWQQVGTLAGDRLQGRIAIDPELHTRMHQQFALGGAEAHAAHNLMRASSLRGREVRTGNDQLGTVEDVVIDFHNKISAPVIRTTAGYGMGEQRVLVHFPRLQVNSDGHGPILASLGRSDMQQLRTQRAGAPTGNFGGNYQQAQSQQEQPLNSAAMAVQQALERAAVPRGSVHVVPESRIVLRGYAESEQKKAEIERAAQQAAPNMRIENHITVRNR
jgi:sporulation protein YlmC with PRC-barrel domain